MGNRWRCISRILTSRLTDPRKQYSLAPRITLEMSLNTTAIIVLHRSDDDSDGHECTVQTLKGPLPVADVKQDLCETLQGFYQVEASTPPIQIKEGEETWTYVSLLTLLSKLNTEEKLHVRLLPGEGLDTAVKSDSGNYWKKRKRKSTGRKSAEAALEYHCFQQGHRVWTGPLGKKKTNKLYLTIKEYEQLGFEQGLQKNVVQRAFRRWKATTTDSEHPISKAVVEDFYSLATDIFWHHKHDVTGLTDSNTPEELKTDQLEKVVHTVLINEPTVEKKPSVSQHTPVEKGEKKGSGDVTSPTKGPIQTTLTLVPSQAADFRRHCRDSIVHDHTAEPVRS
ncbi:hypothetical protein CYMTET_14690 [Cymbomonas tetramitiformis]|uniref:Uncharacterized protein n=1 Tax=Cymbomonas tetramitiformis TaxID=36881 RepID=A0AAE0LA48_9CHLO|nr:hypothetical protein CYMTET_14690 [Cymbomonas tetramitiformis]